ncbi:interleukin-11 receptor subunit alpha [Aplochiton taeniatus]
METQTLSPEFGGDLSHASGASGRGRLHYGQLGSDVVLACGSSPLRSAVEWRLNKSTALPWHRRAPDGTLVLLSVNQWAEGNYSCQDNQGLLLHSVRLRLGYPPGRLNISCRVPNHSFVRCSWSERVKTFLPAQYQASYRGGPKEAPAEPCVVDAAQRHCNITHPTIWQLAHRLTLVETNPLGSYKTTVEIRLQDLLQPEPPDSFRVEEVEGHPTRLRASWRFPPLWPEEPSFPLLFQLRYRPLGSTYWSELESNSSPVTIVDILADHPHQLQLRAQDDLRPESRWSDWTPLLQMWPWKEEDDSSLGVVVLLALFAVVILTAVCSLIVVIWKRQRKRDLLTKQELSSMVKLKSMPI